MADDRYRNYDNPTGWPTGYERQDYGRDYGSGRDTYSSARDYAAAGEYDRNFRGGGTGYSGYDRDWNRETYGGNRDYYGARRDQRTEWRGGGNFRGSYASHGHRFAETDNRYPDRDFGRGRDYRPSYGRAPQGYDYQDRGFMARAGDEVRSWFGDEEAERRREYDQRYDERNYDRGNDSDYGSWRRRQIDALDRDYGEYRQENAKRFENDFGTWRNERHIQRNSLERVSEHMEVVGSDGEHVGTVDKVRGDRILLTKNDTDAGGRHHSIPSRWIQSVDDKVTISKSADQAKSHWRDEERSGALFGDDRSSGYERDGSVNLNKSFSGTY